MDDTQDHYVQAAKFLAVLVAGIFIGAAIVSVAVWMAVENPLGF
jgi:F0F1-type ATP synthase assembly protein I